VTAILKRAANTNQPTENQLTFRWNQVNKKTRPQSSTAQQN